ncbi:MAG: hypothetical protein A2Y03_10075 [Omnitrophica WOR_2 bacterium GWF2_38_59]|nr:MAG: hypothetical protein A2Y03_10075 [Omnitrophica WOR_2 bacterium GWF2_38_59]OGX46974.1 MAG: hypothetical protein A2243_08435 [Omnitrophica WOR_2 bacterium RIFOXYA2_FULL_38_17]OGX55223.1 MAG: hypothetical protein A2447_04605 [Omnitrophica WOR_2 bacterium RIFOXYC2_FULL_38_12]OGX57666.1 MAG: hypothetical protein A2306_07610 [Omnitrophica WOR_2 bacterium RIFOXYB2_FULL_38_16]
MLQNYFSYTFFGGIPSGAGPSRICTCRNLLYAIWIGALMPKNKGVRSVNGFGEIILHKPL